MNYLTNSVKIKDLYILQFNDSFKLIEKYIKNSYKNGVYIGELCVNPYIYESRNLDLPFLVNYIESLDSLVKLFRDIYDEYIYDLRLYEEVNNNYSINFHIIFNDINNTFNSYLSDQFLFEDFSIYQSETSLKTSIELYNKFNENFIFFMKNIIDRSKLQLFIHHKNIKYLPYIYDKIFEQFEYIYLPFY